MDEEKCVYPHWDSTNDYSYADLVSFADDNEAAAITDKITLYADGELIWGVEPDGTKPDGEKKENTSTDPSVTKKAVYGDTNCDGTVELADAILIMQTLASPNKYTVTEQGRLNGDVDKSTEGLTSNDAMFIQEFLLKKRANLAPSVK